MAIALPLLVAAIAVLAWWLLARPPAVFVVRVRDGIPAAAGGKVTDAFLAMVAEVFAEFRLASGEIRGVPRGNRIALWFSPEIPPAACQRLRNWWGMSGWSGPRR
ncbi:MAG TPA: DUF3634 family protein [Gemmata sp.]|nr:DUF3634 family protein [Gemmata sp.]